MGNSLDRIEKLQDSKRLRFCLLYAALLRGHFITLPKLVCVDALCPSQHFSVMLFSLVV